MSRTLGAFAVIVLALVQVGNAQNADESDSVTPKLDMPKVFSTSSTSSSSSVAPVNVSLSKFPEEQSQPEVVSAPAAPDPMSSAPKRQARTANLRRSWVKATETAR